MIEIEAILDAVVSHAMTTGFFDRVNQHEPKSAPGTGLTVAVWADSIEPVRSSGADVTSAKVVMNVRIYASMLQEPQDMIDPNMVKAVDALMAAYSGDYSLDGLVRNVDLLGMEGTPMQAQAGYLNIDGKMYRVMTISLPLVINDVWNQEA